jgi:Cu/Ag efflux pump CusA
MRLEQIVEPGRPGSFFEGDRQTAAQSRRESGSRRIAVEAKVDGHDLGSTAREIRERVAREVAMPTGYFFDVGGKVESQARASRALSIAIVIALVTVFLSLYLALGSFSDAAVILGTLPLAFVGSIVALLLAGETWNPSSLVGLIGLFGIAVQNGLVLVTQTRSLLDEGKSFEDAVKEAASVEFDLSVGHPWGGCMSQELLQSLSKFTVMFDGRAALESEHNLLGS